MYLPEDRPPEFRALRLGRFTENFLDFWRKTCASVTGNAVANDLRAAVNHITSRVAQAQHWMLSPQVIEFISKTDAPREVLRGAKVPHRTMVIEYIAPALAAPSKPDTFPAPNRIIYLEHFSEDSDTFSLHEMFQLADGRWDTVPSILHIPCAALEFADEWFTPLDKRVDGTYRQFQFDVLAAKRHGVECRRLTVGASKLEPAESSWATAGELAESLFVTLQLLSILNCEGVDVEVTPPARTTKKQLKRNKRKPLHRPTYRTLKLTPAEQRGAYEASGARSGERKGPRPHWRRGHIRRVHKATGTIHRWIKPTVVAACKGEPDNKSTIIT